MKLSNCLTLLLVTFGGLSIATALDETTLYNRNNCMGALNEFYGGRFLFNSKLTDSGSLSVAETGESGSVTVYNRNGRVSVGEVNGCQNQDRSLTASKKIAELLRSANEYIESSQRSLKDPNVGIKSIRAGTPEEAKAHALSEMADRKLMLTKLYEVCKAAGDSEITSAISDAEKKRANTSSKTSGTAK